MQLRMSVNKVLRMSGFYSSWVKCDPQGNFGELLTCRFRPVVGILRKGNELAAGTIEDVAIDTI